MRAQQFPLFIFVVSAASILSLRAIAAGPFNPTVANVCIKSPENPTKLILDPKLVTGQLVEKTLAISSIDLNSKGTGIDPAQEVEALLNPTAFCATSACGSKVVQQLLPGYSKLMTFLKLHNVTPVPGKESIDTSKLIDPQNQYALIAQFLRGNPGAPAATCTAAATPGGAGPGGPGGGSTGGSGQTGGNAAPPGYFALRQTPQDLAIPQSSQNFKGAKSASISFSDDQVAQKVNFAVTSAAGYTFGPTPLDPAGRYVSQLTPYVLYNQTTVETHVAKNNSDVEDIGFGLLGDLNSPTGFDGAYQDVKVSPQYVQSMRNGAQVVSGNFIYTPQYGIPGIDSAVYVIPNVLSAKLTPELKFAANDVIEPGAGATALQSGSFYWIGPYADLKLFGEGPLNGFTYDVSYETYEVFEGLLKQIALFQTTLAYSFGTNQLMSIQASYNYGRDLNTLEKLNIVTVGLGLKY